MATDKDSYMLAFNAGSSSIKLTLFTVEDTPKRYAEAVVENIGQSIAKFGIRDKEPQNSYTKSVTAPNHTAATTILMDWLKQKIPSEAVHSIGHRIVHGGPKYFKPCVINDEVLADLRNLIWFDPEHLPAEVRLVESCAELFPNTQQIACFDTAFHHALPNVARLLPIPRKYEARGLRRYGFHGLSCEYIMRELEGLAGSAAADGRIVIAHLGSGVSLTAVSQHKSVDTTMGLTPASGVPMSTRSGDLDPGIFLFLARTEGLDPAGLNELFNTQSGLLGISGSSSDMKQLLEHEARDPKAKEAVDLFCYQVKKSIGSLAAALGGLDRLVFTGGMGEQAPLIRARICSGLEFLGIKLENSRNAGNYNLISSDTSPVVVHVIHTDEALTIAQNVRQLLKGHIHEN